MDHDRNYYLFAFCTRTFMNKSLVGSKTFVEHSSNFKKISFEIIFNNIMIESINTFFHNLVYYWPGLYNKK